MAVVKCVNDHYYDNEKYSECPHCKNLSAAGMTQDTAQALQEQQIGGYAAAYIQRTVQKKAVLKAVQAEETEEKKAPQFTAGWLVCTKGADYGKDFALYAGFNRIGRTSKNDIVLTDTQIVEDDHCSVIYEEHKNVFYLFPKAGSLVYLDGEAVDEAKIIRHGQQITLGQTRLELVVFCIGEKRWVKP